MLDGLFSLTPNMIAWHRLTPAVIYKRDSSNKDSSIFQ
ncbi:hypothetical protein T12_5709 [Trichinella patagoniensis]|uniref:Uncharacterized protein n=1 Tax=Trichinella patagoniensis TaxID=990121 RepID=A0A0V0UU29_9BILA|nr:hypothetical protein T12_5709 [Trichinella patagoniensis]